MPAAATTTTAPEAAAGGADPLRTDHPLSLHRPLRLAGRPVRRAATALATPLAPRVQLCVLPCAVLSCVPLTPPPPPHPNRLMLLLFGRGALVLVLVLMVLLLLLLL